MLLPLVTSKLLAIRNKLYLGHYGTETADALGNRLNAPGRSVPCAIHETALVAADGR